MSQTCRFTSADFWAFSLEYYQKPNVQSQLLHLQDHHQGNVNLALLCLWLDQQCENLTLPELHQLQRAIQVTDYRLQRHRIHRRGLKKSIDHSNYQWALKEELLLEKIQQNELIHYLVKYHHASPCSVPNNYRGYLALLNQTS